MNPYLEPHGFLGTGASLLADVTVLAYLLLIIPAMLVGFVFARRHLFRPYHKWTMTTITLINWILIIFLMLTAYRFDVPGNFPSQPSNTRYLLPVVHGIFGVPAQLLATYVIFRMFREDALVARAKRHGEKDTSKYWFKSAKPIMRLTLALWLVTAVLGLLNYLTRYDVIPSYRLSANVVAPARTPELGSDSVLSPAATPEIPNSTSEAPAATAEIPAATEDIPVSTEELSASATPTQTPEALAPNATGEATGTGIRSLPVSPSEISPKATISPSG